MSEKLKQRIKKIVDANSDKLPVVIFVAIALITSIVAKHMEFSFVITLLISLTMLIGLATTIQITRNKKNLRMILFYLGGTIFCVAMTITVWMMQYYIKIGDKIMFANVIKVFLSILAAVVDCIGIFYIKNKENPKGRRIMVIICMIYFTIIAISAVIFLPPKSI